MDEALPVEQFVTLVEEAMNEKAASKHLCITAKIARQIYDAEKMLNMEHIEDFQERVYRHHT